jgi:hypothetical protein
VTTQFDKLLDTCERKMLELRIECEVNATIQRTAELVRQRDMVGKPVAKPVASPVAAPPSPWLK